MKFRNLFWMAMLAVSASAQANLYTYDFTGINAVIKDNDASGYQNSQTVSGTANNITDVSVTLNISGGYNGDLYGYLVGPNGGFAVLLNRSGKTAGDSAGYSDPGFNVTFKNDAQAASDIHSYTPHDTGSTVTGTWRADGRNIDPNNVLDTDARNALLSSMNGVSANGTWTLFMADMSAGGEGQLVSWGLQINTVPEPIMVALAIFGSGAIIVKLVLRRLRRVRIGRVSLLCQVALKR